MTMDQKKGIETMDHRTEIVKKREEWHIRYQRELFGHAGKSLDKLIPQGNLNVKIFWQRTEPIGLIRFLSTFYLEKLPIFESS